MYNIYLVYPEGSRRKAVRTRHKSRAYWWFFKLSMRELFKYFPNMRRMCFETLTYTSGYDYGDS